MKMDLKKFNYKGLAIKFVVSVLIWIFFKITTAPDVNEMVTFAAIDLIYFIQTAFLTFTAWSINELLLDRLTKRYKEDFLTTGPLLKFASYSLLFVGPLIVAVTWFITYYLEEWFHCESELPQMVQLISDSLKGIMFNVLVGGAMVVNHFWKNKRQNELINEKIIKENLEYKYATLKSQLNPHFLFNSFSVLTSIVHQNPDLASDFISQLSKIYRYVLENKDKEMVPVEEELAFLESYMFLLMIRHDKSIQVKYDVKVKKGEFGIPALALQMLAENAAKHNSFSTSEPLNVEVFTENGEYLVMRNTLKERISTDSTGTGLKNISERYSLLSDKNMIIDKDSGHFTVKLPLIKIAS